MESPLNLAHCHQRKAEILLSLGKFDEAILHHVAAEKALSEIVTATTSIYILQSLKLQRDYHIRQQAVVRRKKQLAEIFNDYQNKLKERRSKIIHDILSAQDFNCDAFPLFQKLLKDALERDTSFMNFLISSSEFSNSQNNDVAESNSDILRPVMKVPVDNNLKFQELCIDNEALKHILFVVIKELGKAQMENISLKACLEKILNFCKSSLASNILKGQKVAYRSFQTCALATETENAENVHDLPALEPVKMPDFNLKANIEKQRSQHSSDNISKSPTIKNICINE